MKKVERTLVILKPDAVKAKLIGRILRRLENETKARIINMKMVKATREQLVDHYEGVGKLLTRIGKDVFEETMDYMSSGMIVPIVLEGEEAIIRVRKLCGPTRPWEAEPGTIRGDFGRKDSSLPIRNVIHASANTEEAKEEIKIWFPKS